MAGCTPSPVEITAGPLTARVEAQPARITIYGPDRKPLLDGLPGESVKLEDAPLVAAAFRTTDVEWHELYGSFNPDENVTQWSGVTHLNSLERHGQSIHFTFDGGSGDVTLGDSTATITIQNPSQKRASMGFRCPADEHFVGFGAQTADVDQHGQPVPLWVSEQGIDKVDTDEPAGDWFYRGTRHQTYFPVPFFLSSHGYGLQLNTTRRSIFDLCHERADAWRVEAWEGKIDLKLYYGPTPKEVIQRHSDEVGRPPLAPAFAFAPWNDAIFGSDTVRQIAAELRQNHIPSSVIWTEDWAGGAHTGDNYNLTYNWGVDRTLYPDVEKVAAELHAQGFKWLAYFNTFVEMDGDHFQEGVANDYVIKKDGAPYLFDSARFMPATMVDLSNPAAEDWMAKAMNAALDLGFDGWMADYGEWQPVDAELHSGEDAEAVHNLYPIAWQKLNERVLSSRTDGVERLVFVRSGYTGSQAITHQVVWGGDQNTEFKPEDGLPSVVPIGINLGISGMPYYGSDIAGYQTAPNHPYSTKELFFRWTTVGAFSPIMRTHHGVAPAKKWHFDSDLDTLAHYGRWARVHQKLYPYLKAAAEEAAATGMPMMRGLMLAFPDDDASWSNKREWLLGPSLLVAPVLEDGARSEDVYLPPGRWMPLFGGAPVDGGRTMTVAVPLEDIPVFVPPGTTIDLLGDEVESLTGTVPDAEERWVYLDAEPSSTMLSWNGATLSACGTPPCGALSEPRGVTIQVPAGGGTLLVGMTQLTVPANIRTVVVRW